MPNYLEDILLTGALDEIKKIYDETEQYYREEGRDHMADYIASIKPKSEKDLNLKVEKGGQTYSVTLHKGKQPGEYDYLKWDEALGSNEKLAKKLGYASESEIEVISSKNYPDTILIKGADKTVSIHPATPGEGWGDAVTGKYFATSSDGGLNRVVIDKEQGIKVGKSYLSGTHLTGEQIYRSLSKRLGSDREASAFLLRAGIDGIEYPAGSLSGGKSGGRNYVVFDENAITIEK